MKNELDSIFEDANKIRKESLKQFKEQDAKSEIEEKNRKAQDFSEKYKNCDYLLDRRGK